MIDYGSWHSRTIRTLCVAGVMDGEEVSDDCEDQIIITLTVRLSKSMLQQGRARTSFSKLWKWHASYYKAHLAE